jgi:hypothetical protein
MSTQTKWRKRIPLHNIPIRSDDKPFRIPRRGRSLPPFDYARLEKHLLRAGAKEDE